MPILGLSKGQAQPLSFQERKTCHFERSRETSHPLLRQRRKEFLNDARNADRGAGSPLFGRGEVSSPSPL
jgi:hypothetical protein